jgi:diguanylate cyclase (GGDEF)-like protein
MTLGEMNQTTEDSEFFIRTDGLSASGEELVDSPAEKRRAWLALVGTNAFSAVQILGALALLMWGPLHGLGAIRILIPQPQMFVVLTVVLAAAAWAPVSLHHRGNTYLFLLDHPAILIGLIFLSPSLLVLSCVCAEAFVLVVVRKQPLIKVMFNVASAGFSTALCALVYRTILGSHLPVSPFGWVAGVAALSCSSFVGNMAVLVVMKINGQTTGRPNGIHFTWTMLTAASVCLSFVVLNAAWYDPWGTVPLFFVAALIIVAYRRYARLTLRFSSLQRLYDFSRTLGASSLEPSSMSLDVLRQVCTVMRARRAELILAEPSGIPRRVALNEEGEPVIEPISLDGNSMITQSILTGKGSLHTAEENHKGSDFDPIVGEFRDAVVAPLTNGSRAVGALVAIDRDEELDSFDEDDLRLFETLAAHASASLERARLVEELRYEVDSKSHQASHDALTGLPNRSLFLNRAASALCESSGVAIVLLDVDRFKDVNDTLGHLVGDRMLCEVSERLLHAAAGRATVARLGGDEFALVIADVVDPSQAQEIVYDLNAEMSRPIEMDGMTLAVTFSAGIALAPEHGNDVSLLLQRADIAMYLAKERRSIVELYSVEQDKSVRRSLMVGGFLTHALETGSGLSVMYQPIADVKSKEIVRVEALARWHHPELGWIPPEEFIGIAEQMGLIGQISEFVLAEACAQLSHWRRIGLRIGMAVNVSGRELSDTSLVELVERNLRINNLPPELLTIEVTETEVMADLTQAGRVLDELADLGIRLAIDDYGTGYSSLAYIHHLPVQELKIDRSFVTNLPNEISNAIIVRSSIAMAHSLGLTVVAEGAEDAATCAILADANCDMIQGHYLGRPQNSALVQETLLGNATIEFAPLRLELPVGDQVPTGTPG